MNENTKTYVSYLRVSTARQGASGLGLDAQREAVRAFLSSRGATAINEYVEIESGRKNDRPKLTEALAQCRRQGATLIVAKLDRLGRNASFLMNLRDSQVDFQCCDMPDANGLTIGVLASVAQYEAEAISQRTKSALQAAKARGVKLGNPNGAASLRRAGKGNADAIAAKVAQSRQRAEQFRTILAGMKGMSLRAMADRLNAVGERSPKGGVWYAATVQRTMHALAG